MSIAISSLEGGGPLWTSQIPQLWPKGSLQRPHTTRLGRDHDTVLAGMKRFNVKEKGGGGRRREVRTDKEGNEKSCEERRAVR